MRKPAEDKIRSAVEAALDERGFRAGPMLGGARKCGEGVYLVAYESRDPSLVFVPDPCKRGRFCRVPRNFLYRGCGHCGALPGQPCHNPKHGSSWSGASGHADRGGNAQSLVPQSFYDDVIVEQALLLFTRTLTGEGYSSTVTHLRWCVSLTPRRKKSCDCGFADREKTLLRMIRQLPDLKTLDYVPDRKKMTDGPV